MFSQATVPKPVTVTMTSATFSVLVSSSLSKMLITSLWDSLCTSVSFCRVEETAVCNYDVQHQASRVQRAVRLMLVILSPHGKAEPKMSKFVSL